MGLFKKEYGRKVGALAWPSSVKPGFALILGEELKKEDSDPSIYRVVTEKEDENLIRLLKWCAKQGKKHKLNSFYADRSNAPMVDFLHSLKLDLHLWKAPFSDDQNAFQYFITLIKVSTQVEQKTLHFGSSLIPSRLIAVGDHAGASASDFPILAACGFALAVLNEEYVANPKVEVIPSMLSLEYGNDLNSPAGDFLMRDSPTSRKWEDDAW